MQTNPDSPWRSWNEEAAALALRKLEERRDLEPGQIAECLRRRRIEDIKEAARLEREVLGEVWDV